MGTYQQLFSSSVLYVLNCLFGFAILPVGIMILTPRSLGMISSLIRNHHVPRMDQGFLVYVGITFTDSTVGFVDL